MSQRLLWVDTVRGFAIILMVIFHFCYDLRYFGYVDWNIPNGSGWWQFRYLILTLFIFTVGVSLSLAHQKKFNKKTFYKRLGQLVISSAAITIMSLFLFPKAWIYFGILHFITLASILGIAFVKRPTIALALGSLILMGFWLGIFKSDWPFTLFEAWLPNHTEDFVPFFPWLGVMYLGIGLMGLLKANKLEKKVDLPKNTIIEKISLIGKHGLIIYLIHQPVLFSLFIAIDFLG
ncbi:MAG: heparan-alpha-glucosaminide N-acetyltransferase [Cellvibrionaceae bacterium]